MYVNYKTPKPQDVKLSVCLMFGIYNCSYSIVTACWLGSPTRLTAHEGTLELTRSFPSNTFDFLCEYHPALTRACLLISYQRCMFLTTDCVFGLVLSNSTQGCCKQQKDSWTQTTVLLFDVILCYFGQWWHFSVVHCSCMFSSG